jgi:hypothetical protein
VTSVAEGAAQMGFAEAALEQILRAGEDLPPATPGD